jgi:hypothetical protein
MVRMIDLIEEFCDFRGYSCERLDGRVSGNDRQKVPHTLRTAILHSTVLYCIV